MATVDVTVRGAGIFGLSVAWACVRRGARVALVDPQGAAAGASGGIVGALAPHTPDPWNDKKAFQFASLLMAPHFWAEVAAASGQDPGFGRTGRLQPLADERALALARQRAASAAQRWRGAADWQVVAATGDPWEPVSATGWLVRDTLSARLHPRAACLALAAALLARGTPVLPEADDAGAVVWATGVAGLIETGRGTGVKGQAALLAPRDGGAIGALPQVFADGLHVVPHADGSVAVGSTSERDFDAPTATDTQLDAVLARASDAVPALRGAEVTARWAGVRPRARSRAPILGAWPGRPGHFVANGGFKIGFGIAPGAAQAIADLVLDGRDTILETFRPE